MVEGVVGPFQLAVGLVTIGGRVVQRKICLFETESSEEFTSFIRQLFSHPGC